MGCASADPQVRSSADGGCEEPAQGGPEPSLEDSFPGLGGAAEEPDAEASCEGTTGLSSSSRSHCSRCDRPARVCVCSCLPSAPFETEARLLVLIHPKETRRACGTVPLLRLCLRNLGVISGASFGETMEEAPEELLQELFLPGRPLELRQPTFLVAPGPSARVLRRRPGCGEGGAEAPAAEAPSQQPSVLGKSCTLVFVDATWRLAKQMVFRTPWLQNLPRVCLEPEEESRYAFRRQPARDCVSTLEAVGECLLALESDVAKAEEAHASLRALFDAMVAHQVSFIPKLRPGKDPSSTADVVSGLPSSLDPEEEREEAAVAKALQPQSAAPQRRAAAASATSYCLARYERGAGGFVRRGVVEETLRHCHYEDAVARGKELSASRSKEDRLHVVPLEKVKRMKGVGDLEFVIE